MAPPTTPNMDCYNNCNAPLKPEDSIKCTSCVNYFHYACAGLSDAEFKRILPMNKNKWKCQACKLQKKGGTSGASSSPKPEETLLDTNQLLTSIVNIDSKALFTHIDKKFQRMSREMSKEMSTINNLLSEKLNKLEAAVNLCQAKVTSIETKYDNINDDVTYQLDDLKASITFTDSNLNDLKKEVEAKFEVINKLQTENESLKSTISDLNTRLAQMEQHTRASNLELQCVPEHKTENLLSIIKQLASTIGYKLNETDVHLCTRVAKINKESSRPRSILIKFSCPRVRDGFLAAVMSFNKKAATNDDKLNTSHIGIGGSKKPIFIGEHLTPAVKAIHSAARAKGKEMKYRFVWVKSGRVYMRKTESSEYVHIKSINILSSLE